MAGEPIATVTPRPCAHPREGQGFPDGAFRPRTPGAPSTSRPSRLLHRTQTESWPQLPHLPGSGLIAGSRVQRGPCRGRAATADSSLVSRGQGLWGEPGTLNVGKDPGQAALWTPERSGLEK